MPATPPPFAAAARFWLLLGWINFGGPAGQIAIMHRELIEKRGWIDEQRFLHALNYCMLLPGPEAMQLAIYIGWLLHGTRGALIAGVGFFLPAVLILLLLSWLYAAFGSIGPVAGVLWGFKPVVVAVIVLAVFAVGRRALKRPEHFVLAAAAFLAIQVLGVPFPLIVLAAIGVGIALSRLRPASAETVSPRAPRIDANPRSLPTTIAIAAAWVALTVVPLVLLLTLDAPQRLQPLYVFFTKAAYVTFGGAYAVLAYVNQAAVESFGWLTAAQAVDGFALAETTPGPLIMVLQFVGFMAGWHDAAPWSPPVAAVAAALLTTYATFLPSFFFILLGAPYVERLRGIRWLDAALAAVTAAVVGVILNLGVVFATAVFWAQGKVNFAALVLALLAALALWRKVNVVWVVLGGGAVGLLAQATGWI